MIDSSILPAHRQGASTGASTRIVAETRHEAILLFGEAKRRLMDVNHWDLLCGPGSATFRLCDAGGARIKHGQPAVGNLIRIDLPAPPNHSGEGYDWVRIEAFEDTKNMLKDEEIFGFRVRPVRSPLSGEKESAHFYTSDATSTFLIVRSANTVQALERGRNEKPNLGPASWLNKIRNAAVALAAMFGLATPQWKSLMKGVLKGPPEETGRYSRIL